MKRVKAKYGALQMLKQMVVLIIISCLLLNSSCKKTFSSNQFIEDKLVILAEISANDSVKIPVGKSIKVGNGSLIRFDKVNDARVLLKEGTGPGLMLKVNYSPQYAASPSSLYTSKRRLRPNTTYTIEVQHALLGTITATTHIPSYPKVVITDTFYTDFKGRPVLGVNLTLEGPFDENSLYIFEGLKELMQMRHYFVYRGVRYNYDNAQGKTLYAQVSPSATLPILKDTVSQNKFLRLNLFTDDLNTENAKIDNLENPFRRIFLSQIPAGATSYPIKIYLDPQFFLATDPTKRGRVRFQVKLVSKELYDYLLVYEKYKTDFGLVPSSQLVSPTGNISKNGLGIFGGSAKREKIFYFDHF